MPQSIPILMYHSISSTASDAFRRWIVSPELFDAHMAYLCAEGYTPLTISELVARMDDDLPARPVAVTFDDGFEDFHAAAVPVLTRHTVPSTLYVCTGYVGETSRWLTAEGEGDRPMMTWAQIRDLPAVGVECGAHTRTHPQLDTLPWRAAEDEIRGSREDLELHLGVPIHSFAYPHGYHSASVQSIVREAGFTSACGVKHAMSSTADDRFALARIIVEADTDVPALAGFLEGRGVPPAPTGTQLRTRGWRVVRRSRARLQRLRGQRGAA